MDEIVTRVKELVRLQSAIARTEWRAREAKLLRVALALVLAFLALAMLDVAAFLGLGRAVGPVWAAAIVGVVNAVLAGVVAVRASRIASGAEAADARARRDEVLAALGRDLERLQVSVAELGDEVRRTASTLVSIAASVTSLLPGVSALRLLLARALRRTREDEDAAPDGNELTADDEES